MKIQITMDSFPLSLLEMFENDLKCQNIRATIQVGGEDTVFACTEVDDVVKAQIFAILCDKYRFAKGGVLYEQEEESGS